MSTKRPNPPPSGYTYNPNRLISPAPPPLPPIPPPVRTKVKYVRNSTDDLISRIKILESKVISLEEQIYKLWRIGSQDCD